MGAEQLPWWAANRLAKGECNSRRPHSKRNFGNADKVSLTDCASSVSPSFSRCRDCGCGCSGSKSLSFNLIFSSSIDVSSSSFVSCCWSFDTVVFVELYHESAVFQKSAAAEWEENSTKEESLFNTALDWQWNSRRTHTIWQCRPRACSFSKSGTRKRTTYYTCIL